MARAALEWTVDLASRKAGVPRMIIIRFEGGQPIAPEARDTLRRAYHAAGAEILSEGPGADSVRFVAPAPSQRDVVAPLRRA